MDFIVQIIRSIMENVRFARRFGRSEEEKVEETADGVKDQSHVRLFAIEQKTIGHFRVLTHVIDVVQPSQRFSSPNRDDRCQQK